MVKSYSPPDAPIPSASDPYLLHYFLITQTQISQLHQSLNEIRQQLNFLLSTKTQKLPSEKCINCENLQPKEVSSVSTETSFVKTSSSSVSSQTEQLSSNSLPHPPPTEQPLVSSSNTFQPVESSSTPSPSPQPRVSDSSPPQSRVSHSRSSYSQVSDPSPPQTKNSHSRSSYSQVSHSRSPSLSPGSSTMLAVEPMEPTFLLDNTKTMYSRDRYFP
ncbi:hypothetical protein GEMRC1_003183 [Eukaryota sp. GEM-RC1]